jgi:hypothetical protein
MTTMKHEHSTIWHEIERHKIISAWKAENGTAELCSSDRYVHDKYDSSEERGKGVRVPLCILLDFYYPIDPIRHMHPIYFPLPFALFPISTHEGLYSVFCGTLLYG